MKSIKLNHFGEFLGSIKILYELNNNDNNDMNHSNFSFLIFIDPGVSFE